MILIADNFQYQGRKPLDSRLIVQTTADMAALPESVLYEGMLVYNIEKDKYFSYVSTNTVDNVYGK